MFIEKKYQIFILERLYFLKIEDCSLLYIQYYVDSYTVKPEELVGSVKENLSKIINSRK